jgi:biopolymer transport protein ExbB
MNIAVLIRALGNSGGDWVLYVLVAFSMVSIAVILERAVHFWMNREPFETLVGDGIPALAGGNMQAVRDQQKGPVGRMLHLATEQWSLAPERLAATLLAHRLRERATAERGLVILGTLGNNAPFVGLFGTVLGIIRSFQDLGNAASQGPAAVMTGLSEALVATAVGIMVAIPAVIFYNLYQRSIRVMDYQLEEASEAVVAIKRCELSAPPAAPIAR